MNDKAIYFILSVTDRVDGLISRESMARLLMGQASRAIMKNGLDHIDEFGALADMSKSEILSHVDYLIERGCLSVGFLFFPNLSIMDPGRNRLARMPKLEPKEAPLQADVTGPEIELDAIPYDDQKFWMLFPADLAKARQRVVIISAFVSEHRVNMLIPNFEKLIQRGVKVKAYIRPTNKKIEQKAIERLKGIGIDVVFEKRIHQKIAIIDDSIAWGGSLNILQHINSKDQMTRHSDPAYVKCAR